MPKVPSSDARDTPNRDTAPEVFGWLCDNALHALSTGSDRAARTSSLSQDEVLWAWQLAWLALDLVSAPENNLPELGALTEQSSASVLIAAWRAMPVVPRLSAAAWQELRRARELLLFASLPTRESWATDVPKHRRDLLANALSATLSERQLPALAEQSTFAFIANFQGLLGSCLSIAASERPNDEAALTDLLPALHNVLRHLKARLESRANSAVPGAYEAHGSALPSGPAARTSPDTERRTLGAPPAKSAPARRRSVDVAAKSRGEHPPAPAALAEEAHPVASPPRSPNTGAFAAPTPPVREAVRRGDEVQFTVFRPNQLAPERWSKLLAFAHLAQRRPDAPAGTPDPITLVQEQAQALLGSDLAKYRQLSEDAGQPIPFEGQLTFIPEVDGVKFDPPRASILWVDDVQRVEFRMRPSAQLAGSSARGRLSVFCGSILVAELQLSLRVAASQDSESQALAPPESTRMYRKIFASYSHQDASIVEQVREIAKVFGDRYLIDVSDLRSGELWSDALEQLIREADVFQLFWSWSSMRSPFVRREWEYALQLGRPSFVRPTYWEQPMPAVPGEDLPPAHLASLHFHALSLPSASQPPTAASPAPAPGLPPQAAAPVPASDYIGPRDDPGITLEDPAKPQKPGATWLRRVVPASSAVALGAALLFVLKTVNVLGPPIQQPPAAIEAPSPAPTNADPVPKFPIEDPPPATATLPKPALQPALPDSTPPVAKPAEKAPKPTEKPRAGSLDFLLDDVVDGKSNSQSTKSTPAGDLPQSPSRDDVLKAMKGVTGAVKTCSQGQAGVAFATFTVIGRTGRVSAVDVTGISGEPGSCIARAVYKAVFPKFSNESFEVKFPFRL